MWHKDTANTGYKNREKYNIDTKKPCGLVPGPVVIEHS